jgi:hypothetical protein
MKKQQCTEADDLKMTMTLVRSYINFKLKPMCTVTMMIFNGRQLKMKNACQHSFIWMKSFAYQFQSFQINQWQDKKKIKVQLQYNNSNFAT